MKLSAKTIIMGLAVLAIAAAGVYGLTQTFGGKDASVTASKAGLPAKGKNTGDAGQPVNKYRNRGSLMPGMGF